MKDSAKTPHTNKKPCPAECLCVWFTHLLKNDHFSEISPVGEYKKRNQRWFLPRIFFSPHFFLCIYSFSKCPAKKTHFDFSLPKNSQPIVTVWTVCFCSINNWFDVTRVGESVMIFTRTSTKKNLYRKKHTHKNTCVQSNSEKKWFNCIRIIFRRVRQQTEWF